MNFFIYLFLILTSVCIQLSQCCGAKPQLHTIITIRRVTEQADYLMFGSLLRENIVITTPHYLFGANIDKVFVEANCRRFIKNKNPSNSCTRRSISKIIFENDYNTTQNFMDSIAIVILKTPFIINNFIQLASFAEDITSLITSKCIHAKQSYTRYGKSTEQALFYYGSFHKESFDYQAKFKKTTVISKSAFDYPVFPKLKNKKSLYNFILEQDHDIQISHDSDEKYLGTPILCPHIINQNIYFQIGVVNYFFRVNSKTGDPSQSKQILYYISVVDREHEIIKKVNETLRLDRVQT